MNTQTKIQEANRKVAEETKAVRRISRRAKYKVAILADVSALGELSPSFSINPWGDSIWLETSSREDVVKLLSLRPLWKKSASGRYLKYQWDNPDRVCGVAISVMAADAALPPTCHVIRRRVVEPARPENIYEYDEVICEKLERTEVSEPTAATEPSNESLP